MNQEKRLKDQGTALRNERACDERRPWTPPRRRLWPLAALAALCAACAGSDGLPLGPIGTAGHVQETYRTTQFADESRRHSNQNEVFVQANSYVWQPWFVTVNADMDVAYDLERGGDGGNADSLLLSGGTNLGILPLSRYPGSVAYRHRDSRVEGRVTGGDFISDRVDLTSQAIISDNLRTFASAGYELVEQPDVGSGEQVRANLSVIKQFTTDQLTATLSYDDEDFDSDADKDEHETTAVGSLAYDSRPFENLTAQSIATAIYDSDEFETSAFDRLTFQGLTTAQWRPPDLPFTVNGALRALTETIEAEGSASGTGSNETTNRILNGTIGLNYPIRPRLTANAGINGRIESIEGNAGGIGGEAALAENGVTTGGSLLGSLSYQSLTAPMLGFDWSWNANGSTNLSAESDAGITDQETVAVGHSIDRNLVLPFPGAVSFRASEELEVTSATADRFSADLFHNLSVTHNSASDGVSTFARASLSDRRDLVGGDGVEFQLLQFVLSRQEAIDLTSSWLANLSIQVSRQKSAGRSANTTASANGTAVYRKAEIFGVRDLRFVSELTLSALGLESVLTEAEKDDTRLADRFRSEWVNRLEYQIGRIFASLEGGALYSREQFGNTIFLRIRREFGGGAP